MSNAEFARYTGERGLSNQTVEINVKVMDVFIKAVRGNQIKHPTQQGFILQAWQRAFEALRNTSDADRKLYDAGLWTYKKLNSIRTKLNSVRLEGIARDTLLKIFAGSINRKFCALMSAHFAPSDDNSFINEEMIQAKLILGDVQLPNPEDVDEAIIDGARYPLIDILSHPEQAPNRNILSDEEILYRTEVIMGLGRYYDFVEDLWAECLWHGWHLDPTEQRYAFDYLAPPKDGTAIIRAVTEYRRRAFEGEDILVLTSYWRNLPNEEKQRILKRIPQVVIKGVGQGRKYEVRARGLGERERRAPPLLWTYRFKAQHDYRKTLLDEPLPKLKGLTLNKLLDAWEVFSSLAEVLLAETPVVANVSSAGQIFAYSPVLRTTQVQSLLSKWLNTTHDESRRIIKFFTYKPQPSCELWVKPLIKLDDDQIIPLLSPLLSGNILRTMERWMKEAGLDLGSRGRLFEGHARHSLKEALDSSKILTNTGVLMRPFRFRSSEGEEEIDIVLWFKNVVLVGEAKCTILPTEPLEFYRYYDDLKTKSDQIRGKLNAVLSNTQGALAQLGLSGSIKESEVKFVPFVLTNQPLGVGRSIQGIPVVDLPTLWIYLGEGVYHRMVTLDNSGRMSAKKTIPLYRSEDEAVQGIEEYLQYTWQFRHYFEYITARVNKHPALHRHDRRSANLILEVKQPLTEKNFTFNI